MHFKIILYVKSTIVFYINVQQSILSIEFNYIRSTVIK